MQFEDTSSVTVITKVIELSKVVVNIPGEISITDHTHITGS